MNTKKILIFISLLALLCTVEAQTIQGSLQQGAEPNKVNVVYLPDHNSTGGYVNNLSISIAIPSTLSTGVTPTIAGVGNFASLAFSPADPFTYTEGSERIYSWICANATPLAMSWTAGNPFTGATITLTGGTGFSKVRLVDFLNLGGGANGNTFFSVGVNIPPFDLTNYTNVFYSIGGANGSTTGVYANTDQFVETNLLIALPVTLLNFNGYKAAGKNILQWRTVSELNNLGFEIQRSINGIDFIAIGFVNAKAGNANNYSYVDNSPMGMMQYYRLKQVDINNASKLSNTILLKSMETITGITINKIFPNPASELINVSFDAQQSGRATFIIYDESGKIIYKRSSDFIAGSNTQALNISILPLGTYWLSIKSANLETEKQVPFVKH